MSRLVLIDGSGLMHRAYHVSKKAEANDRFEEGDGMGAVKAFHDILERLTKKLAYEPGYTHYGIIFDASRSHARMEIWPEYKAHRGDPDDAFKVQMQPMKEEAAIFGAVYELFGYEADDILATYARMANEAGMDAIVVTQDKDLCQIVNQGTTLFNPIGKPEYNEFQQYVGSTYKTTTEIDVIERWGVTPSLVPDLLAIMGDTSDNIPGIAGVGEKTAAKLIHAHGSVEAIVADPSSVQASAKIRDAIFQQIAADCSPLLAKQLVTIDRYVPVTEPLSYFETL